MQLLVDDQEMFDSAFPVDCGTPVQPNTKFIGCSTTSDGTCTPSCTYPYTGSPTAVCSKDGNWTYGGECTVLGMCFAMGFGGYGQLASEDTLDATTPSPVHSADNELIIDIEVGGWHTAFRTAQDAYIVGYNSDGQLATSTTTIYTTTPLVCSLCSVVSWQVDPCPVLLCFVVIHSVVVCAVVCL